MSSSTRGKISAQVPISTVTAAPTYNLSSWSSHVTMTPSTSLTQLASSHSPASHAPNSSNVAETWNCTAQQYPRVLRVKHIGFWGTFRDSTVFVDLNSTHGVKLRRVESLSDADVLATSSFGNIDKALADARAQGVFTIFGTYEPNDFHHIGSVDLSLGWNPHRNSETYARYMPPFFGSHATPDCGCDLRIRSVSTSEWLARPGGVVFINSHRGWARDLLVRVFNESSILGNVACPAKAFHNMPWPSNPHGKPKTKLEVMSSYKFIICPENTHRRGYTTEKLPHALEAGVVPIYYGGVDQQIYNRHRMLLLGEGTRTKDDFSSHAANLVSYAEQLITNATAREAFFAQPVLAPGGAVAYSSACRNAYRTFERAWIRHVARLARGCEAHASGNRDSEMNTWIIDTYWRARGCRAGASVCCGDDRVQHVANYSRTCSTSATGIATLARAMASRSPSATASVPMRVRLSQSWTWRRHPVGSSLTMTSTHRLLPTRNPARLSAVGGHGELAQATTTTTTNTSATNTDSEPDTQ